VRLSAGNCAALSADNCAAASADENEDLCGLLCGQENQELVQLQEVVNDGCGNSQVRTRRLALGAEGTEIAERTAETAPRSSLRSLGEGTNPALKTSGASAAEPPATMKWQYREQSTLSRGTDRRTDFQRENGYEKCSDGIHRPLADREHFGFTVMGDDGLWKKAGPEK